MHDNFLHIALVVGQMLTFVVGQMLNRLLRRGQTPQG